MLNQRALRLLKHNVTIIYTVPGEIETVTERVNNDNIAWLDHHIRNNTIKVLEIGGIKLWVIE